MENPYPGETGCCPRFDPAPWDEKEHQWTDKRFVKDKVRCIFHMPLNFGKVMKRSCEKISAAGAFTPQPPLALSDHTSPWSMDLYIEVAKEVPNTENIQMSGNYLSKVFEGPYSQARNWCKQMADWVRGKDKQMKRQLVYYTTCPKCAKHYGKNYVVYFAQV